MNVPPEFNNINVVQQDNNVRVYLTLSDYNSWEDIFDVNIILDYYGSEVARFTFNQYSVTTSYQKTNIFSETSKEGKKSRASRSSGTWGSYTRGESGFSKEKAWFDVSIQDLQKIANAKKVEVLIFGKNDRVVQKEFKKIHFKDLKEFLEYCDDIKKGKRRIP